MVDLEIQAPLVPLDNFVITWWYRSCGTQVEQEKKEIREKRKKERVGVKRSEL